MRRVASIWIDRRPPNVSASPAVDDVRRRVQQESTGHCGRKHDPLFCIRRLLRRRFDRLSERDGQRILAGLEAGDVDQHIGLTWIAAQDP
jgi:transposase